MIQKPAVLMAAVLCGAIATTSALAPAHARKCMRPGMSDVAFGKAAAIESAHTKLIPYAEQLARERGWSKTTGLVRRNKRTVKCEVYLDLGIFGTEYQCLVRATFCTS